MINGREQDVDLDTFRPTKSKASDVTRNDDLDFLI